MYYPYLTQEDEEFLKKAKKLSDKELRELIKTKTERKRKLKEEEYELYQKYCEQSYKRRREESLIFNLKVIRGKKKGEKCPVRKKVEKGWGVYWECLAKSAAWERDLDRFYALYCSGCRYTDRTKKMKVFVKKITGKNRV